MNTPFADAPREDFNHGNVTRGVDERMVPGDAPADVEAEHLARYRFACTFAAGKHVLDVACGSGYGAAMLADAHAASVIAIDVHQPALDSAAAKYQRNNLQFRHDDAQKLATIADDSADLFVSFETLEHLPDDAAFIRQVLRVLKPGGHFLVSTPNRLTGRLRDRFTGRPSNPHHVREYSDSELRRALEPSLRITQLLGQRHLPALGIALPVQLLLKPAAVLLARAGMPSLHRNWYRDGDGVEVAPVRAGKSPRFFVASCRKDRG